MIPKFRAWVKPEKKMYLVRAIDFDDNERLCSVTPLYEEEARKNPHFWPDPFLAEQVVLMQSTGVKDCNGKEIYEGDIVEITYAKQVWDAIPAYCGSRKAKYNYLIDSLEDFFYTRKRGYIADSELKVLGNIYKDPELEKQL